jgi:hypothetical protein
MDKLINRTVIASLLATSGLFAGHSLQAAKNARPVATTGQTTVGYHGVPEQKLNAFAAAYVKVVRIYSRHAEQVEMAENAEQAYQAQAAIEKSTAQAIQEEGLSPDEYNAVVRTINENPALGRAVAQKIRALQ